MIGISRGPRAAGLALMGLLLALSGCARNSSSGLSDRLSVLVGQPVSELARRMGNPDRVTVLDGPPSGRTRMDYRIIWPIEQGRNLPSPVGTERPSALTCDIQMFTRAAVVESFSFSGPACGWGGLPDIRP